MASLRVGVQLLVLVALTVVGYGTAQFQTCYDNGRADCGGNEVTGVSTTRDCCLGDGFWFRISGQCVQCIVHGFERTVVLVDEGNEERLVISLDIKGTTADELPQNRVNQFDLTVMCQDVTTERARDDYSSTACGSCVELDLNDPAALTSEVLIMFPADSAALEGTEELRLELQLSTATQAAVDDAANVFFQDTSIQIRDTTVLASGYQEEDYSGNEGPDRLSPLPNLPCTVTIRLQQTSIETDLTFRLTPRTVSENVAANGPPPTGSLRGTSASRADFNATPFEVTMRVGTEAVTTTLPIIDDNINEPEQDFVVVLEVASNTTNPLQFTIQTVVCRIPENDPIEIGFRRERIVHNETTDTFVAVLEKDRPSEQTFVVRFQISTPQIPGVGEPATEGPFPPADFRIGPLVVTQRLSPEVNGTEIAYTIFEDNVPENTEIFQLSSDPDPDTLTNPRFTCDESRGCFQDLQVLILDDDVVEVGFVETLVEVEESDGQATLNVSISFPEPNPVVPFEIMFRLYATMTNITAGARPASFGRFDPVIPGIHDYQEIAPASVLVRDFEDSRRSQTFCVLIYQDEVLEGVEELNITLSLQDPSLANRVIVRPAVATVRIYDSALCYDDAAANCGGNVVLNVNPRDCCLGDGFWVNQTNGECVQCIVHGFNRTMVSVDEGDPQETIVIGLYIKGNTPNESSPVNFTNIDFNLTCTDMTAEEDDYNTTDCDSVFQLRVPDRLTSEVNIAFPADSNALEGTEILLLKLQVSSITHADAGNIFIQDLSSIQIHDTTALRLGFQEEEYMGAEGQACSVVVRLWNTTTVAPLKLQLSPRTITASSPLPTGTITGAYASRMDFNDTQPFEVTMTAGTQTVSAEIPIVDDEINEADEEFVVVLEVASDTTNPVEFTVNTTMCRIAPSDPIEIGFEQGQVNHSESDANGSVSIAKSRQSEQTFQIEIQISTPRILGLGVPATRGDDFIITNLSTVTLTPEENNTEITYQIVGDELPERTEIFLISISDDFLNSPGFDCDGQQGYFSELHVSIIDDDVVVVGFVETGVEVNENDGTVTLNISISSPPSDVVLGFEFTLLVNTVDGSARSGSCSDSDINTDFTSISQSLIFGDTQRSQTVFVTIIDNNIPEGVEALTVRLSLQDMELGASVELDTSEATVRILDNDIPAQFTMCYDNAATDCNGTVLPNVTTARNCCLGDGYWFDDENGTCHECIVHGFVNTSVTVDEGSRRQIIEIRQNIKGTVSADQTSNSRIVFTVICNDNTAERDDDYCTRACNSIARLRQNDTGQVAIDFPRDSSVALEGTEGLLMELQLSQEQLSSFTTAGNIFIQNVSIIQIRDITNITLGFSQEDYEGNESPDQACRVNVSLHDTTIEAPLTLQLIPQTIPENDDANGPRPTATLTGVNASRMDFNGTPFEIRMLAGDTSVTADIPIVNDEINEAEELFVVVLEVVSNTTNPVVFTNQTAVCRILQSDPIEIGFTQDVVQHNESNGTFLAILRKSRQSEQTFDFQIQINTSLISGFSAATQDLGSEEVPNPDFNFSTIPVRLTPDQNETGICYQIYGDNIPENMEVFQLSSVPGASFSDCDCSSDLQVQIIDDDVLGTIGFVDISMMVEVNESVGEATLNVSMSLNSSLQFEIMFSLFANTMNDSAGSSPAGIEDYEQIENMSLDFNNTQRSQTFTVTIFDDNIPEGVEELKVALSLLDPSLANQVIVEPAVATVRIWDNDSIVVGFERTLYVVNETNGQVELCVNVTQPADIGDVTFNLTVETQNGTAMGSGFGMMGSGMVDSGTDYDYMSVVTTLATFTTEQPRQCFNVTIISDLEVEATEDFFAILILIPASVTTIDPNQITVHQSEATVNIVDNVALIKVGYNVSAVSAFESDGMAQLTVAISMPNASVTIGSSVSFYLFVNTSNRAATAPSDYGALTDFPLGPFSNSIRQLSFNVPIVNDTVPEVDEVFTASLTLSPDAQVRFGNLVMVEPDLATVTIHGMSPVPSTASTSYPGSVTPSPSMSPTDTGPSNLWALFALLPVILLVLLIVTAIAIVYVKRRRRNLKLKSVPSKESPEDEHKAHPFASHRPSVQLRRMLPHRMIIPSSVLKLQDSIGQGEFGVVYKARLQWHLDAVTEVVAVKTLKGLFSPNDVDDLVQEVLKMHTLSHPNVMSLTGVCLDAGGGPAVVMPFMGNGSVLNYLKKERGKLVLPGDADCSVISDAQRQLLGMCLQISKGMEYLAKEKIVHRDLAARNCMMDSSGVIKVADFGLSVDVYTSTYYRRRKSDTAVKLPVRWMAPESTEDGIFTEKSDVWSFGVTCWEVFTGGHIPYSGISPVALLQLLRNGERLNKPMNPACSDEIYAIMLECWKEGPKERPNFSKLVGTISLTLEAVAGYMDFSLSIKDEHPVAAEVAEVKTRAASASVQSPSEKDGGGQRETAV